MVAERMDIVFGVGASSEPQPKKVKPIRNR
jgi:hypothetical protein